MQFYLISDNADTHTGMRLAGIDGVIVHNESEVRDELNRAAENPDIAVVLLTDKLFEMCGDYIYDFKLKKKRPLVVEIPDRHATSHITSTISRYLQEAIGISL
ncbi:MAG: ATP synthase subunit F [Ruminococcus sp.]|nr:ATP synthase subunit F [Ruminococcus sp.]